ncbi:MAG: Asp-tRNA(Asn)/Glu-tRNA(Gln) amidotransferase subunit GatC [Myxococcota bacterium]|nr:Asp-tRNA(Asn)/Glu-tRNA(Gln) amidotransferase subunit GatC [Myxococcota bacterium]
MARLARLEIEDDQISVLSDEIGTILEHVATLSELDTTSYTDDREALRRWPDTSREPPCPDLLVRSEGFRAGADGDQFVQVPTVVDKNH